MDELSSCSDCEDLEKVNKHKSPQPYLFELPAGAVNNHGASNVSSDSSTEEDTQESDGNGTAIERWCVYTVSLLILADI